MRTGRAALLAASAACALSLACWALGASATAASPRGHSVQASIVLTMTPASPTMLQTRTIDLFVPRGFYDAGARLPYCKTSVLIEKRPEACPKRSLVGAGASLGYTILGGQFVPEHLGLELFNGPGASLLTWVEGHTPVEIEAMVQGVIGKPAGYGQELAFTIPQGLLEPLTGAPGWLQKLEAHLNARAGWLRTTSCPAHPWSLKAQFGYTNGEALTIQTQLACV